jgi:Zn-dependent protease with chaperone function
MNNPTNSIDISFDRYVEERSYKVSLHTEGGIPDYAFATDYALRQKLKAIPGVYSFFKAVTSQVVPLQKQKLSMNSLKVGPSQYPDIYEMTKDCARTLGIGIPTVYIENSVGVMNAYAMATEDTEPLVILTSSIVERCTPQELKAIIGHECGHIHNNHGIYNIAANVLINETIGRVPLPIQVAALLSTSIRLALQAWSRAAEVTCDRAGIICCGEEESTSSVHAKLMSGGMLNRGEANIDEVMKQYEHFRSTPVRLLELGSTHPSSVRRIFAAKEFVNSEVYYKWHPEQKTPGQVLYSKQELDARCDKFVSVLKSEGRLG